MHPCLEVYDIIECICSHLASSNSLDALAKFARTCSTILDPALNALWHTIPTLEPLIRCLPKDAWTVKCTRYYAVLTLARKTTPEDWARCVFYTHRIRHFGSSELEHSLPGQVKGSTPTDKKIYMALRPTENTTVPLLTFPKLRSCRLVQHTSSPIPHYSPFLTQTLLVLELRQPSYDADEYLLGTLRSLPSSSPFLRRLEIHGAGLVSAFESVPSEFSETQNRMIGPDPMMKMLCDLHHLESLVCPCIQFPDDAVRYLATRMKTRVLQLKNSATEISDALSGETECFAYLEQLILECGPLAECTKLLERMVNIRGLESLEVWRHGGSPPESEIRDFIQSLSDLTTPPTAIHKYPALNTTLRKLLIQQTPSRQRMPTTTKGYTVTLNTLEPLLFFPFLTDLSITTDTLYAFNDTDACKMARAWPWLRELQLGFPGIGWGCDVTTEEGRLTLDGLRGFARWCKELKKLGVCFDMSAQHKKGDEECIGEQVEGGDDVDIQCCSLRVLEVGDSVFHDEPEYVAKCLLDIFPKLCGTFGPDPITSIVWQRKWSYVTRALGQSR